MSGNPNKDVKLRIVGKDETAPAFASAIGRARGFSASLGGVMETIRGHWLALTGIVAGGALFKEVITSTIDWTSEVVQLSKRLGITTEAASGLNIAIHHVGITVDDYAAVAQKMTKQLRTNEDGFQALGIRTKESNGEWRNSQDVMGDAIEKLNGMKAGTDRNIASQALFGARVGNLTALLRLNKEMLEESAQKAEKYHLIVGPDGAAKMLQYKGAMADLHLVGESVSVTLGNALLPTLLQVGAWMGENGPLVTGVFIGVLRTLRSGLELLLIPLEMFWTIGVAAFGAVGTAITSMGSALYFTQHFQFATAKKSIVDGLTEIKTLAAGTSARLDELASGDSLKAIWNPPKTTPGKPSEGDTLGGDNLKKDAHKEFLKQLHEEVGELTKAAELGTMRLDNLRRLFALQQQMLTMARDPRATLADRNAAQAAANALEQANPLAGSPGLQLAGGPLAGKMANIGAGSMAPLMPPDVKAVVSIGGDIADGFERAGDAIKSTRATIQGMAHDIGDTARNAIDSFAGAWGAAAQAIGRGAMGVGQAIAQSARKAVGASAAAKGQETLLDAGKAFAQGFHDPSQFLVAAKLFAIGTGYEALAGVMGGGGGGGAGGAGGLSPSGFQQSASASQQGTLTVVFPGKKSIIDFTDPMDQAAFKQMIDHLAGTRQIVLQFGRG